jgi:hypothetical protein
MEEEWDRACNVRAIAARTSFTQEIPEVSPAPASKSAVECKEKRRDPRTHGMIWIKGRPGIGRARGGSDTALPTTL